MKCSNYLDYTTSPGDLAWPKVPLSSHSCVPPRNQGLGLGNYFKIYKNRGEDAQSPSVSDSCHELCWNPGQLLLAGSSVQHPGLCPARLSTHSPAPTAAPGFAQVRSQTTPAWRQQPLKPGVYPALKATFFTPPFLANDASRVPRTAAQPLDLRDRTNTKL